MLHGGTCLGRPVWIWKAKVLNQDFSARVSNSMATYIDALAEKKILADFRGSLALCATPV
jgi:hypothetical protein